MFVCLVLYILLYVLCYFTMGVCQWEYLYKSLVCLCVLSCLYCFTSYAIQLQACVKESICMKVCMCVCLVLYILSYVLCYLFMGVCQWEHIHVSKCLCIYYRTSYVISLCFKLIIIIVYILCMLMRATGSHWLFVILVKYIKNIIIYIMLITNEIVCIEH
jgi:hypothetical protein